jgi:large subunit ribosomal protein L10
MAKTREQKEKEIEKLAEKLSKMKAMVFANYDGLKVKEVNELRKTLREQKIDYLVSKKTLMKLALKKAGLKDIKVDEFVGGVGLAFGYEDEILPAKMLNDFAKTHQALKLIGGILENKFIAKEKVLELARIPGKQELLTMTVWVIKSPIAGLVNVLSGSLKSLLYALSAIKDKNPHNN